jgi:hypothetical protein
MDKMLMRRYAKHRINVNTVVKKVKKVIHFGSAMDLKEKMTDRKRHTK